MHRARLTGACLLIVLGPGGCDSLPGFGADDDATISRLSDTYALTDLPEDPAPEAAQILRKGRLNLIELRSRNRAYADRYRVILASACDTIMRQREDPSLRKKAHQLKLDGATAIYDIVVDNAPQQSLLNLVVQVTLQHRLANATAEAEFPEDHPLIVQKVEQLYREVWGHASLVMDKRERIELLAIIDRWWEANSGQRGIWYVRLSDLSGYGQGTSLEGLVDSARDLPSQIINTFVPLESASDNLDEFTSVSEVATWFAPRLVILTQWRLEALVYESLATTQITETIDTFQRLTEAAESLPEDLSNSVTQTLESVTDQEEAISSLLERTESLITSAGRTSNEATELTRAIDDATRSLTDLTTAVDPIIARITESSESDPSSDSDTDNERPFDIREYTAAADALDGTLEQAESTIERLDSATRTLDSRLVPVTDAIGRTVLYITLGIVLIAVVVAASIAGGILAVRRWSPPSYKKDTRSEPNAVRSASRSPART